MRIFLIFLLSGLGLLANAQTDHNGNPVFNSVMYAEEKVGNFTLVSSYYTLRRNIESKTSSVYISDTPSLDEVEHAALSLPSENFVIAKNHFLLTLILIDNALPWQFLIVNSESGDKDRVPCLLKGDISENRAKEIVKEKYDSLAFISGNKLHFNGKEFVIISNAIIRMAILDLVKDERLNDRDSSSVKYLSQAEIKDMIISDTKAGGKLDFFTEIKGHEYDGVQIKPGLFSTRLGMALYKWGSECFELGVNKEEDALEIFGIIQGRTLNQREREYIVRGFKRDLDN